jgi:hypothetical protein
MPVTGCTVALVSVLSNQAALLNRARLEPVSSSSLKVVGAKGRCRGRGERCLARRAEDNGRTPDE